MLTAAVQHLRERDREREMAFSINNKIKFSFFKCCILGSLIEFLVIDP